jgi:hypothetical protein
MGILPKKKNNPHLRANTRRGILLDIAKQLPF